MPDRSRADRWPLAAAAVLTVVHGLVHWSFTIDDAAITFAYARGLASGLGFGALVQGGYRVEGYSNLLWMLLLAAAERCGLRADLAAKLLGLVAALACVWIAWLLLKRLLQDRRLLWGLLLLPCSTTFAFWSISGLENALYGALVLAATVALLREDEDGRAFSLSAILLWLALLTRPDGVVFALAAIAFKLARLLLERRSPSLGPRVRQLMVWLIVYGTGIATVTLWRRWYFASDVPNTVYAKASVASPLDTVKAIFNPAAPGWRYVLAYLVIHAAVLLLPFAVVFVARSARDRTAAVALMGAASLGLPLYRPDWMVQFRFMYCAELFLIVAAVLGADLLLARWTTRTRRLVWAGGLVVASFYVVWNASLSLAEETELHTRVDMDQVEAHHAPLQRRARELGLADPLFAIPDLGATSYRLHMRVLDLGGLADVSLGRSHGDPWIFEAYVFGEQQPDLIHMWKPFDLGVSWPELQQDYVRCSGADDPQYVRRDLVFEPAPHPQQLMSADGVILSDVLAVTATQPSTTLPIHLFWRVERPLAVDLQARIRLADASGQTLRQITTPIGYRWLTTSKWPVGETVRQYAAIEIPKTPGPYTLGIDVLSPDGQPIAGAHYQRSLEVGADAGRRAAVAALHDANTLLTGGRSQAVLRAIAMARAAVSDPATIQPQLERMHDAWDTRLLARDRELLAQRRWPGAAALAHDAALLRGRRAAPESWRSFGQETRASAAAASGPKAAYLLAWIASEANHQDAKAEVLLESARRRYVHLRRSPAVTSGSER